MSQRQITIFVRTEFNDYKKPDCYHLAVGLDCIISTSPSTGTTKETLLRGETTDKHEGLYW